MRHTKKRESMVDTKGKKTVQSNLSLRSPGIRLIIMTKALNQLFEICFKKQKEMVSEGLKKPIRMMSHQINNFSKNTEILFKKSQNRNSAVEKYNLNEKFTRGTQQKN